MPDTHLKFHSTNGKRLVLIVEDNFVNREMLKMALSEQYEILEAENGQQGYALIDQHRETLSLVLLDLHMPVMNGQEVLSELRKDAELRRIPVIVLTDDRDSELECLRLGAMDFIPKPIPSNPAVMLARIERIIQLHEDNSTIQETERDPLTGLYNREFFYHYAEQFDHFHKDMEMDAIVVDINHFHMINERFGKQYGDGVLRLVGEKVREMVAGAGGIVCRRDSDTYMVYCPHRGDYQDILENASIGLESDGYGNNRIRLRMGVYSCVDKGIDMERRFDRAKNASDTVRGNLGKAVGFYDSALHESELYQERLVEDFRKALREEQFVVYYQPKFHVQTEIPVLASAEALVRWQHPELGMISPGVFIPLFEENGLIRELDSYVWNKAAAQIRDWKKRLGISVPVSVNVSRIDMYDPNLVEKFQNLLVQYGLEPEEYLLEITESAYTQDSAQIISTVNRLRELGFQIEMDDFGTGYSSLNMISSLPIDALKLDMKFIRNAFRDGRDTRMIEVIIDIADYLSVPIIAEGVETEEQLLALKALGCDIVQGYYFSKPVPAEEYERFVREKKEQLLRELPAAKTNGGLKDDTSGFAKPTSIAHALTSGFEAIYYVNTRTDQYVQFSANGPYEDLQIERSGMDFFADTQRNIPRAVYKEDQTRVALSMQKDTLLAQLTGGQSFSMTYRLVINGQPTYYNLRAVNAYVRDRHHIVIGVSNVEDQVREALDSSEGREAGEKNERNRDFLAIAQALSIDFESVYYVSLADDSYTELTAQGDYESLHIETDGQDFFGETKKNIPLVVYEEDQPRLFEALEKEQLLSRLDEGSSYSITYRLIVQGEPKWYRLKAVRTEEDGQHIVIGVSRAAREGLDEEERSVTYARIAAALSQDYFSIYYVNTVTDDFSEYSLTGNDHRLNLVRTGEDFFADCTRSIPAAVMPDDQERALEAFDKEHLLRRLEGGKAFTIQYRLMVDSKPIYAGLKALRLPDDEEHIVIGVSNIDEQMQREKEFETVIERNVTYSNIAQALAADYFSIYYVSLENDHFIEFSAHDAYASLNIEKGGDDFFNLSLKNISRVVHPEDAEKVATAFTKENLLNEMARTGTFTLTYRLMFDGKPTYVSLKASRMADDDKHIVIGVNNIDAQIARERELNQARDQANRDSLTGVKSKHFYAENEREINAKIEAGTAGEFGLVFCDVNGLKHVNDTLGHQAGDDLIKQTAMVICNVFEHSPVFRYGGDEFVALLRGRDWQRRAELMDELARMNTEHKENGGLLIANGLAEFREGEDQCLADVLARADAEMYENKQRLKK